MKRRAVPEGAAFLLWSALVPFYWLTQRMRPIQTMSFRAITRGS